MSDEQSKFISQAIAKHNEYRRKHGAPKLKHSPELSQVALKWASYIASRNSMQHSNCDLNGKRMGENIAMFHSSHGNGNYGDYATKMWYDEIDNYNFSRPGFTGGTGHFTQVVWKESTEVGFGIARASNGYYYAVANYYPAGNFQGKFQQNVLPIGNYPADEDKDDHNDDDQAFDSSRVASILFRGRKLTKGQEIKSPNGRYRAVMQEDGNFVLYGGKANWASNTMGRGDRVIMQDDGNLVVYNGDLATWASNTYQPGVHHILIMQDDGNLVVYNSHGEPRWASNTNGQY